MYGLADRYREMLDATKKHARKLLNEGSVEEAAKAYERCSNLASRIATEMKSEYLAQQCMTEKEEYKELAKGIRSGEIRGKKTISSTETGTIADMDAEFEEIILSTITQSTTSWNDIIGLDEPKKRIQESIVIGHAKHDSNISIKPTRGMLLYGPPGTGKTLLAAATSARIQAIFLSLSVDVLMSRYVGDAPKLVSTLYRVAREKAPSIIFIDDFETLVMNRNEGGKNLSTGTLQAFLASIGGFTSKHDNSYVLTIAATNTPWILDPAILRRFEKRIYIPLPDHKSREQIFRLELQQKGFTTDLDYYDLAASTEHYSGSDISTVCKEMQTIMLRRSNPNIHRIADFGMDVISKYTLKTSPILYSDFLEAILKIRPVWNPEMEMRFNEWRKRFGAE